MDQQVTPGKMPQQEKLLQTPPARGCPHVLEQGWSCPLPAWEAASPAWVWSRICADEGWECRRCSRSLVLPFWLFPTTALRGSQQPSVTATLGTGAGEGVGISQLCPGTSTAWIHACLGELGAGGEKYPPGLAVSRNKPNPCCSSTQRGILQEGRCRWLVQSVVGVLLKNSILLLGSDFEGVGTSSLPESHNERLVQSG